MSSAHPGSRANYRVETIGGAAVVRVSGDIDVANAGRLGDGLRALLGGGRPIVIDISAVTYIDSVGLHVILRVFQRAQVVRVDAVLVAAGLSRHLVKEVGVDRIVRVVPDLAAALEAFEAKSQSPAARG